MGKDAPGIIVCAQGVGLTRTARNSFTLWGLRWPKYKAIQRARNHLQTSRLDLAPSEDPIVSCAAAVGPA